MAGGVLGVVLCMGTAPGDGEAWLRGRVTAR